MAFASFRRERPARGERTTYLTRRGTCRSRSDALHATDFRDARHFAQPGGGGQGHPRRSAPRLGAPQQIGCPEKFDVPGIPHRPAGEIMPPTVGAVTGTRPLRRLSAARTRTQQFGRKNSEQIRAGDPVFLHGSKEDGFDENRSIRVVGPRSWRMQHSRTSWNQFVQDRAVQRQAVACPENNLREGHFYPGNHVYPGNHATRSPADRHGGRPVKPRGGRRIVGLSRRRRPTVGPTGREAPAEASTERPGSPGHRP